MKIIIFGGDGFCGWPTALHLSTHGHDVMIVDNFARRRADDELGIQSLTPIETLDNRVNRWNRLSWEMLRWRQFNVATDVRALRELFLTERPDAIVHFAEQRAAPYSMKSALHKQYTVTNNVNATHNILSTIADLDLDVHIVHLGTMGVYGYGTAGSELPEGYVNAVLLGQSDAPAQSIVYPPNPGSVYHMTKVLDAQMFQFYAKNDRLRITDLHQGIVWGTNTLETLRHPDLINRFDYDGDYGTVLNRFLAQAAIGHPLTVHGSGGQTRAFIHIRDTVRCVALALEHPPERGERPRIFNQTAETHRLIDLAQRIVRLTSGTIAHVVNPRKEADRNDLLVANTNFKALGWQPILLDDGLLEEIALTATTYADRIDVAKIPATTRWVT